MTKFCFAQGWKYGHSLKIEHYSVIMVSGMSTITLSWGSLNKCSLVLSYCHICTAFNYDWTYHSVVMVKQMSSLLHKEINCYPTTKYSNVSVELIAILKRKKKLALVTGPTVAGLWMRIRPNRQMSLL